MPTPTRIDACEIAAVTRLGCHSRPPRHRSRGTGRGAAVDGAVSSASPSASSPSASSPSSAASAAAAASVGSTQTAVGCIHSPSVALTRPPSRPTPQMPSSDVSTRPARVTGRRSPKPMVAIVVEVKYSASTTDHRSSFEKQSVKRAKVLASAAKTLSVNVRLVSDVATRRGSSGPGSWRSAVGELLLVLIVAVQRGSDGNSASDGVGTGRRAHPCKRGRVFRSRAGANISVEELTEKAAVAKHGCRQEIHHPIAACSRNGGNFFHLPRRT